MLLVQIRELEITVFNKVPLFEPHLKNKFSFFDTVAVWRRIGNAGYRRRPKFNNGYTCEMDIPITFQLNHFRRPLLLFAETVHTAVYTVGYVHEDGDYYW